MTNGELREVTESSSATESDSETVVMFNFDRLNEDRLVCYVGMHGNVVKFLSLLRDLLTLWSATWIGLKLEVQVMGLVFVGPMS